MLSTLEFLTIRDATPIAQLPTSVLALIFSLNALTLPYLKLTLLLCLRIWPHAQGRGMVSAVCMVVGGVYNVVVVGSRLCLYKCV